MLHRTDKSTFWRRGQNFKGSDGAEGYGNRVEKEGLAPGTKILNLSCRNRKAVFVFIINV